MAAEELSGEQFIESYISSQVRRGLPDLPQVTDVTWVNPFDLAFANVDWEELYKTEEQKVWEAG